MKSQGILKTILSGNPDVLSDILAGIPQGSILGPLPCADLVGEIGGPGRPWKITSYMGFYRN